MAEIKNGDKPHAGGELQSVHSALELEKN